MNRLRVAVIVVGVGLALVAVRLDDRRLTWVAIGVLSFALALRLATPRPSRGHDTNDEDASP